MALVCTVNAMLACVPVVKVGPDRQELGWPAYLGSPQHDAAASETLNPDPRPLWHTSVGRGVRGSPAIGEGVVVVGAADRNAVLVDRTSGEVIWRQRLDGTIRGGPLLDDDRIYIATEAEPDGRVYALHLKDGKTIWKTGVGGGVAAPIAFDGDALYAGIEDGAVVRLSAERGNIEWRRRLGGDGGARSGRGAVRAGPVPTPYGLAVATTADTLYLLDRSNGTIRARLATPGSVLATPASDGRRLYFGTMTGKIVAVDLASWTIRWERDAGDAVYGAPALVGDTLYVLARDGHLWRIPTSEPERAQSHDLDIVATAGPTPLASGVLVGSVSGEILLVDRSNGAILWRAQVVGPIEEPPLVRERQVVVVGGRGNIHSYR